MKHIFVIGEKEKHEIEVDPSWTRKVTIRVDGKIRAIKRLPWRGTFCKLKIGDEEIHKVELKWSGIFPKIRCFIDGKLHSRELKVLPKWEKPVNLAIALPIFIIICGIAAYGFITVIDAYDSIIKDYNSLVDKHNQMLENFKLMIENLERALDEYQENLEKVLEGAKLPPYVVIENRNVNMVFKASDETLHYWTVPVETLEATIVQGYYERKTLQYVRLEDSETGEIHRVVDFRPFVDEQPFSKVISDLYHGLADDEAFVREVWYIVIQLTTYSQEVEETPRFPLETMIGGGGDCEDMAILIASMLKAAPADYVVELVYMDMDNPTDPRDVNHVLVWVETPSGYKTFVDGTSKTIINPFTKVEGWYFEV